MRIGILWSDGDVLPRANITHAMESFIYMRRTTHGTGVGPVRLMGQRQGAWFPLVPDVQQIKKCMLAIGTVMQYDQMREERGRPNGY